MTRTEVAMTRTEWKRMCAKLASSVRPVRLTAQEQRAIYERTMRGEEPWQRKS